MRLTIFSNPPENTAVSPNIGHKIRTPLHGIANSVELLEESYQKCQTIVETKNNGELQNYAKEVNERLQTVIDCAKELIETTSPKKDADKSQVNTEYKKFKTFIEEGNVILTTLSTQIEILKNLYDKLNTVLMSNESVDSSSITTQFQELTDYNKKSLTVVKMLTEKLIHMNNELPKPKFASQTSANLKSPLSCEEKNSKKINVLIVDDNPVNQKILMSHLKKMHCQYELANDGRQGVELFSKNKFDIVFMDINMPHMNGFEAALAIRQIEKTKQISSIPIVCVTASGEDPQKAFDVGMNDYLAKPFSQKDITLIFKKHLESMSCFSPLSSSPTNERESTPSPQSSLPNSSELEFTPSPQSSPPKTRENGSSPLPHLFSPPQMGGKESLPTLQSCSSLKMGQTEYPQTESLNKIMS